MDAPVDGSFPGDASGPDALALLRLFVEWGADEVLDDTAHDRRLAEPAALPTHTLPARPLPAQAEARPSPAHPGSPAPSAAAVPASTIEELRAALLAFEGCQLRFTAKSLAFADGNPGAGLVVVGEAPSDDDDREGRPFAGPGGAQLDRVFASIGLDRHAMLLTLLVPWRTPGKRPPSASEVASCLPFLQRHLFLLRPRRLVLFGGTVTRALGLGPEPIGRLRGTWRDVSVPGFGTVPALAMRPVETALKTAASKRELWGDLMELKAALLKDTEG